MPLPSREGRAQSIASFIVSRYILAFFWSFCSGKPDALNSNFDPFHRIGRYPPLHMYFVYRVRNHSRAQNIVHILRRKLLLNQPQTLTNQGFAEYGRSFKPTSLFNLSPRTFKELTATVFSGARPGKSTNAICSAARAAFP